MPLDENTPPVAEAAEQALLGVLLRDNRAYEAVSDILRPEHFSSQLHGEMYAAIQARLGTGQAVDGYLLLPQFKAHPAFADSDKPNPALAYMARLQNSIATVSNAKFYASSILAAAQRRELIVIAEDIARDARDHSGGDPEQIIEGAEKRLQLVADGTTAAGLAPVAEAVSGMLERLDAAHRNPGSMGTSTGLAQLDRGIGGLVASDLLVLAGRPGMGKTALAMNIAFNVARAKARRLENGDDVKPGIVAVFSLEMPKDQLAQREVSRQMNVSATKMDEGRLSPLQFDDMVAASQEIASLPLHIDDQEGLSPAQIRTRARRLKRRKGLDLIVIDYLQLMRPDHGSSSAGRVEQVSEITKALKGIAKELDVPVLALSQLSRKVEERDDKRPQLADLRESGSIEQDSDIVMFVFREEYYAERDEPIQRPNESESTFTGRQDEWRQRMAKAANLAEIIVGKRRRGPTGKVMLHFNGETTSFSTLARDGDR